MTILGKAAGGVRIRRAAGDDLATANKPFSWLLADGWRADGVSLVAEEDEQLVGVAMAAPNRVHPLRDVLQVEVVPTQRRRGIGTALIHALRAAGRGPFGAQASVGSNGQAFLASLGAVRYQWCPPQTVDTSRADVQRWCTQHVGQDTTLGSVVSRQQLIDFFTTQYRWQHQSWNPPARDAVLRELVGVEFTDDTNLDLSRFAVEDGAIVAGCAVYSERLTATTAFGNAEAADPARRETRSLVASCMASTMLALEGRTFEFDGHGTDPHFHPLLASIPGVTGDVVELVEVP